LNKPDSQPAKPESEHGQPSGQVIYCGLPRRLMVMLYDSLIVVGLLMVASALALPFGRLEKIAGQDLFFTLWLLLVFFLYLAGCWRSAGMTVGMRAWRVKLVDASGGEITWLRCALRFVTGFASFGVLGLGLLWSLFDRKNRCWHDLAGQTLLIRNAPPKKVKQTAVKSK